MTHTSDIDALAQKTHESLIQKALDSLKQGNADQAESFCQTILAQNANHPEANYLLGILAIERHSASDSLTYFENALDAMPENGTYWIAYIKALLKSGQADAALQVLVAARQAGLQGTATDELEMHIHSVLHESGYRHADTDMHPAQDDSPDDSTLQDEIESLIELFMQGFYGECAAQAQSLLQRCPNDTDIWKIFGAALKQQGRISEALDAMRQSVLLDPMNSEALNNLGLTLKLAGNLTESETFLRRAIAVQKDFAEAHNNLGVTLWALGLLKESETCFRRALEIKPDYAEAMDNLGVSLKDQFRFVEAETSFHKALENIPHSPGTWNNLGNALQAQGRLQEAETCLRKALELDPKSAVSWNNLGNILQSQGDLAGSEQCYLKAIELNIDYTEAWDGLLFVSNYDPDKTGVEIFNRYREFDLHFGHPSRKHWRPHGNIANPDRKLRVGYVSPAFYCHPVRHFFEPLLAHHNRDNFEIILYSDVLREDQVSAQMRQLGDPWISTVGLSDEELTEQIRRDGIDILVDLAGHTGRNRLLVFARKPAPISLHWLDFGYTTGLSAIDYYLTDLDCAPIGSEELFAEKLWRLPAPALVYRPSPGMGEEKPLPALRNGYITFGTLSRSIRINHRTLAAWSEILRRIPDSHLVIDSGNFKDVVVQSKFVEQLAESGIPTKRLHVGYHSPPWEILRNIDIALDCFPHNSGTTLFECLYMGVPFISLADRPSVGRLGTSILKGINHPEWIATSESDYIDRACRLATDLQSLNAIRSCLRREMQTCSLMNEEAFAIMVETAYRQMFRSWCTNKQRNETSTTTDCSSGNRVQEQRHPDAIEIFNHGIDLQSQNQLNLAKNQYLTAINLQPNFHEAYNNLGTVLQQEELFSEAEDCFLKAIEVKPEYSQSWFNLGNTFKLQQKYIAAESAYRQATEIQPDFVLAHYNLGNILQEQGRIADAECSLRRALHFDPYHINSFSTLLFTINYHPDKTSAEIFADYIEFNSRFCLPLLPEQTSHCNGKKTHHRLKVGYVAPNYNHHPARHFIEPLLTHHDRNSFEIYAYVDIDEKVAPADLFHRHVEHWRSVLGLDDDSLSKLIRDDSIDILIDLAGHTAGNRLGVFARKPAPVSLHWLDFGYTTGLTAIDYYLADPILIPGGSEVYFSEKPWRIAAPALVYLPPAETGPVNALPALTTGRITFGTLTRAVRINHRTIRVWAEILRRCPNSRLIVNSGSYREPSMQDQLASQFAAAGIDRSRLEIGCNSPPWDVFRRIDVCLDCFPHNSGTTLVEGLYMGVPFITLADRPSVGRLGSSILHGVGHPEWIAFSEEEYVNTCLSLASDVSTLAEIREKLREEMQNSLLMDGENFVKRIESAYQEMFEIWATHDQRPLNPTKTDRHRKPGQPVPKRSKNSRRPPQCTEPSSPAIIKLNHLLEQGKLGQALPLARSLSNDFPESGFSWKILGPLLYDHGAKEEALQVLEKAAHLLPDDPDAQFNLGYAQQMAGLSPEAVLTYQKVISLNNRHFKALFNLANILSDAGNLHDAEHLYRQALAAKPGYIEATCNLGNLLRKQGKINEAVAVYQHMLATHSDAVEVLNNFAFLLKEIGSTNEAEIFCRKAIDINHSFFEGHNTLGLILQDRGELGAAEICFRKALRINSSYSTARCNLSINLQKQGRLAEAERLCLDYLGNDSKNIKMLQNLGVILINKGNLPIAESSLRQALELNPQDPEIYSNLFFLLNNHPDKDIAEIFSDYQQFDVRFGKPLQNEWRPHSNNRETRRKLKVGYVSPQFRRHSTRHFLEPLLAHHDKNNVEVYAYADIYTEDEASRHYRKYVDHWIRCKGLPDAALAERIRADGIDILVDLAGHTGGNRLGVFARKPAPVSLHWLDFGYTTGLSAIDYYLTDPDTVPAEHDQFFAEQPWRIDTPCLAYRPEQGMGEVGPLPALERGFLTFGTLTRAVRINHRTIRVWSEILRRVDNAHLVIDSGNYKEQEMQTDLIEKFQAHGIAPDRLEIGFHSPPWDVMRSIDIGLDCFPHNSGTTLFESLYMGIPFVTLTDRPCVGRLGGAILKGIGHPEWIARSEEEYIERAVSLAGDLEKLAAIRSTLRQEMQASPLMDEQGFARKVENAYRQMFEKWCEEQR